MLSVDVELSALIKCSEDSDVQMQLTKVILCSLGWILFRFTVVMQLIKVIFRSLDGNAISSFHLLLLRFLAVSAADISHSAYTPEDTHLDAIFVCQSIFPSRISGRGYKIGPICLSVCLSVCVCVCVCVSQLSRG